MKKTIKIVMFITILNLILYTTAYTLILKKHGYNSIDYYNNNHQIDIIWLGPSTTYFTISPMYIWKKYNITSFNNSHTSQKITSFYALKDMKKYNPKVIFFDITSMVNDRFTKGLEWENSIYKWYLSFNSRIENMKYMQGDYKDLFYIFILNKFHTRWKEITEKDYINNKITYFFLGSELNFTVKPQKQPINNNKYKFTDPSIDIIKEISQYIQDNKINVVFWCPPTAMNDRYERSFLFDDIIKQYDIPYINFNKIAKEIHIDYDKDFYDNGHLNIYGGYKITDYLIEYAIKHYNIPSHKNDPTYASWNEDYIKYARAINREEIRELKSFDDWKKQAFYDNYTVMLSTNGDVLKKLPDTLKNNLKSFGLTKYNTDKPNMRYTAIIDDNKVFFEEVSNKPVTYKGRMKNIVNLLVTSDGKATINVSGKARSKNKYGLNFVIYDKVNREIVDSIWIDPRKPDVVRR